MIVARTGNRANCKICHRTIDHGDVRIVEEPFDCMVNPEHYHITCYKTVNQSSIEEVAALLRGGITERDILRKEWEVRQSRKDIVKEVS